MIHFDFKDVQFCEDFEEVDGIPLSLKIVKKMVMLVSCFFLKFYKENDEVSLH